MTTISNRSKKIIEGFAHALLVIALSLSVASRADAQAPLEQRVDRLEKMIQDIDKKLDRVLPANQKPPTDEPTSAPANAVAQGQSSTAPKPAANSFVSKPGAILSAYELSSPAQAETMQTGPAALFHFVDESASFKKSNFLSRQPGPTFAKSILGVLWEGYLDITEEDKYVFIFDAIYFEHRYGRPQESNGHGVVVMLDELNLLSGREWKTGACTSKPVPLSKGRYELRVWLADGGDSQDDHTLSFSYMPLGGSAPRPITPRSLFHEAEKELK